MEKSILIKEIVDRELKMFLAVQAKGSAACQENPEGFRFYRTTLFTEWSEEALTSYLDDLAVAEAAGKNLITLKYARMENIIPELSDNPLIDRIVELHVSWVREMVERYPNLHRNARPVEEDRPGVTSTKTYIRGELETYSDRTLERHYLDLCHYLDRKENPMEGRLRAMLAGSRFSSLEEAEDALGR